MPGTMDFVATGEPRDLIAALSLATGTMYSVQNVDPASRVFIRIQAAAPARTDRANVLHPWEVGYPTADPGESIWIWTDRPDAAVVVNEA